MEISINAHLLKNCLKSSHSSLNIFLLLYLEHECLLLMSVILIGGYLFERNRLIVSQVCKLCEGVQVSTSLPWLCELLQHSYLKCVDIYCSLCLWRMCAYPNSLYNELTFAYIWAVSQWSFKFTSSVICALLHFHEWGRVRYLCLGVYGWFKVQGIKLLKKFFFLIFSLKSSVCHNLVIRFGFLWKKKKNNWERNFCSFGIWFKVTPNKVTR